MDKVNYNPDVLSCLANLSNDEVFTPPELANRMLDLLPQELWSNPDARFLDPACKSGLFIREMAKRLITGLEPVMPDLQRRVDHIFTRQLYGIAITELTSLLSRRSAYCSKKADGPYSVAHFGNAAGNIAYSRTEHTWRNGRCVFCGASEEVYSRGDALETHAYQFIHTEKPQDIFKMKFDVIIGNPPYQLSDGGGRESSAVPLYHLFVEQAIRLSPRYLIMIIPARWYSGGKGLDSFRSRMLNDQHLAVIHDFPETSDCFPGLNIRGGICYFLWDKYHKGDCTVVNHIKDKEIKLNRPLHENGLNVFIRYNEAITILKKVRSHDEETLGNCVSSRKPFGIDSNFDKYQQRATPMFNIKLYRFGDNGYVNEEQVKSNKQLIQRYKVIVSKASPGGDEWPHMIVSLPIISEPGSVCTETYLVIKDFDDKEQAVNLVSYIKTKFFRFMMALVKSGQNISKASYSLVPMQDFSEPWTDEKLYKKYGLTDDEIAFIDSMIRPME